MSYLIGTWELVGWTASVGHRLHHPFGGDVVGRLTYTSDGHMWAALMRRDRQPVTAPTLAAATEAERASAAAGYLSYSGTYTETDGTVTHHVELSLLPNWVGEDQVRVVTWVPGDNGSSHLELSTVPARGRAGGRIVNRLRWRRLSPVPVHAETAASANSA